jgi:tetratricopeptide (TPR) repeat protein
MVDVTYSIHTIAARFSAGPRKDQWPLTRRRQAQIIACTMKEVSLEPDELLALARRDAEGGRLEEALRKLKPLVGSGEALVEALPLAARIYAQLELTDRAQACYRAFLAARPDAVLESFELGMTHFDKGDTTEAATLWAGVLERSPTHPPTLFYRALLAARQGKTQEARRDLHVLFEANPSDNLYVGRGRELLEEMESRPAGH